MKRKQAVMVHILRGTAILLGVICIIAGSGRGETAVVLRKAVRICLECIGVA